MKSREDKVALYSAFNIFLTLLIAVLLFYLINVHIIAIYLKIIVYIILFISFGFLSFFLAKHFLAPLVQTKFFLELLLKDTLHELNIPLSVIQANLQMLKQSELDEKKAKRLARIELACEDLKRLYKDVDYYIKREVRQEINEVFSIHEIIIHEIEKFKNQESGVRIVAKIGKDAEVFADKHGFTRVLDNIISNAIKYNRQNNDIIIELEENRLSIIDNGIGMSEADVFKIFDRYYQQDPSKEGYGIGLSIVKAYCDEQRIFINISSKLHVGTKVTLDLRHILR